MAEFERCTDTTCKAPGRHAHVVGYKPPEPKPIERASVSIAQMVDEWHNIGLDDQEKAQLAKLIERRLSRFWPKAVAP